MPDSFDRYLERQSAQGDGDALERLDRQYQRRGELHPDRRDAYARLLDLLWLGKALQVQERTLRMIEAFDRFNVMLDG